MPSRLAIVLVLSALAASSAAAETKIAIGTVQSFGAIVTYLARDKGYFKAEGLDVDISFMNSSANMVALLAQNQFQIVEGGVSVGYFNAVDKGLPMIMTSDRVSTPIHHVLLVRSELKGKITKLTDLRGRNVGSNSVGAVTTYELGKVLESAGMNLQDIELKTLGFPDMNAALKNGALDATLDIPPFAAAIESQGIGFPLADVDDLARPTPMTIAASFVNTGWANQNKEAIRGFFTAYMRATREYCQAYHHGANRDEVIQIALKNGLDVSAEHIDKEPWTGRNVDGHAEMASVMDQQDYYAKRDMVKNPQPAERLFTSEYIDFANKKLGPAPAMNPASKLPGCH